MGCFILRSSPKAYISGYIDKHGDETVDPNADRPPPVIITRVFFS